MRIALAAMCVLTLLATAYLSASLLILQPPRANMPVWFTLAAFFVAQGALTLTALGAGPAGGGPLRYGVLAGACAMAIVGVWMVRSTLTSDHFEGYALVLGSLLVVQSVLTLAAFLRRPSLRMA